MGCEGPSVVIRLLLVPLRLLLVCVASLATVAHENVFAYVGTYVLHMPFAVLGHVRLVLLKCMCHVHEISYSYVGLCQAPQPLSTTVHNFIEARGVDLLVTIGAGSYMASALRCSQAMPHAVVRGWCGAACTLA